MERTCIVCGTIFESSRSDARFDTDACRKKFARNPELYTGAASKELEVVDPPKGRGPFRFRTKNYLTGSGFHEDESGKVIIRTATRWYDVPLGAVPLLEKGDPKMPEWMDGRQYFLWRENDFRVSDADKPIIINPIPSRGKEVFVPGGAQSRQWGA